MARNDKSDSQPAPTSEELEALHKQLAEKEAELAELRAKALADSKAAVQAKTPMRRWLIAGEPFFAHSLGRLVPGTEVSMPADIPGGPGWTDLDTLEVIPRRKRLVSRPGDAPVTDQVPWGAQSPDRPGTTRVVATPALAETSGRAADKPPV